MPSLGQNMIDTIVPEEAEDARSVFASGIPILIGAPFQKAVGIIQNVGSHNLSILLNQAFAEGGPASIEFGSSTQTGRVVSCEAAGKEYKLSVAIPATDARDLRKFERFPVTFDVRVWVDRLVTEVEASVFDLSSHGMGLETPVELTEGESIGVEGPWSLAFGVVRHSRPVAEGRFRVGVEILHCMPKDRGEL